MMIKINILILNMLLNLILVHLFLLLNFDLSKNAIVFVADNSSSVHIDNKNKEI